MVDLGWFQHNIKGHLFLPETVAVQNFLDAINWKYWITVHASFKTQPCRTTSRSCKIYVCDDGGRGKFFQKFWNNLICCKIASIKRLVFWRAWNAKGDYVLWSYCSDVKMLQSSKNVLGKYYNKLSKQTV